MSDIQITVTGDKELIAKLNRLSAGGLDLEDSMDSSGRFLTRFFSGEVFASRGRVINEPWPALNSSYAAWKARQFPGRPPLVKTGEMMRSFKHTSSARRLELFNTSDYFAFHQDGTRHLPQRVMMKVDNRRVQRVAEFIAEDLAQQMQRAGLV